MKHSPHYPKVLTLGSAYTQNALQGSVILQEKIDGSQFGFGLNEDRELTVRSHGKVMDIDAPEKMFNIAVDYVKSIETIVKGFDPDTYFYCEYLSKPKHNVLNYDNVPMHNLVLFDVLENSEWVDREEMERIADLLGIDVIPELWVGSLSVDELKTYLDRPSYLGNETIEGVVVKNYKETILLGGQVSPLFTKYVNERFRERHSKEWKAKSPKGFLLDYMEGFKTEARWLKAIQHLKDNGELENQPRDIGKLVNAVHKDIEEEESENIKNTLYKKFIDDILRMSIRGLPEWYKNKLLENLKPSTES